LTIQKKIIISKIDKGLFLLKGRFRSAGNIHL